MTVGNELLLGFTVDTNGAWLGREMAAMGLPIGRRLVVGDRDADIRDAVAEALESADIVVVTGGLGPTEDDITRESVAALLDRPLELDENILAELEERFRARVGQTLPKTNVRQARVPEGATVLENRLGTAPGLILERDGRWVVLLPGVPREMRGLFTDQLAPRLREHLGERLLPLTHRTLHTTGIAESALAEQLEAALPTNLGPVTLAYLPHVTGVELRLTAHGPPNDPSVEDWLERTEALIAPVIERFRYESHRGDLVEDVAARLVESGRRLAVAESCTGGLVAKRITDLPGSSRYFAGGVVAYANEVKVESLGVPAELLGSKGAVSEEVALAMAEGVARSFGVQAALSVTGVAGPGGGSDEKPVGTVWYGVYLDGRTEARRRVFPGDRPAIRERSAQAVLALLHRMLRARA